MAITGNTNLVRVLAEQQTPAFFQPAPPERSPLMERLIAQLSNPPEIKSPEELGLRFTALALARYGEKRRAETAAEKRNAAFAGIADQVEGRASDAAGNALGEADLGGVPTGIEQPIDQNSQLVQTLMRSGNPQFQNIGLAQALAKKNAEKAGFSLSPGQTRFDAQGRQVANVPASAPSPGRPIPALGPDGKPRFATAAQINQGGFAPIPRKAPTATATASAKGEGKEAEVIGGFRGEQFVNLQKAAQAALLDSIQLNRVEQLVKGLDTGSLAPLSQFFKKGLKSAGIDLEAFGLTDDVGQAEALQSLAVNFTLEGVAKTKGAVSNKEMEEFAKIGPSLGKSPEGIALIIEMRRGMNQLAKRAARLARAYRKRHGSMEGFGDVLEKFHQENPLFTERMRGKISKLQQAGLAGGGGQGGAAAPGALVDPRPDLSLEDAENLARERGLNIPGR